MSILDYIDSSIFSPVYDNKLPVVRSQNIIDICNELYYTIKANEPIFIYGDYDMDGFCSILVWCEVLATLYDVKPYTFKYTKRQHTIDKALIEQAVSTNARVVIICDTGSSEEDRRVLNSLWSLGRVPIVIDHHVYEGNYFYNRSVKLIYNAYEERNLLGDAEISGAYASLLVAKYLCEHYFNRPLSFNAMVYALASMYSDVVDMSTPPGRALYNVVSLMRLPGPTLLAAMNKFNYSFSRRFFSFIISPKINACFRTESFDILNSAMHLWDKYKLAPIASELEKVHAEAKNIVKTGIKLFTQEQFGDVILAIHESTVETQMLHIRNFSGLIANTIAKENHCMAVVVIKDSTGVYSGSFRDCYNRKMLDTFRVFCEAEGHDQAFGITFKDIVHFRRYMNVLSTQLISDKELDYIAISGKLVKTADDVVAMALYNEYMNTNFKLQISYCCPYAKLIHSSAYRKIYDVGLPYNVRSENPLTRGSNIIIEPCITKNVELRCID